MKRNTTGFSIIEILIGIMIFSLGLISVYMLLFSAMKMNEYSKNSIIASNLAREGIEIIRNVRDNNYNTLHNWNKFPGNDVNAKFMTGIYYTIENDFITGEAQIEEITDFDEGQQHLSTAMKSYQLFLTPENYYTYNSSETNTPTYFYRFIYFEDVQSDDGMILDDAIRLKSKIIWFKENYHSIEIDTILTHFQRD